MPHVNLDRRLFVDDDGEVGTIVTMLNDLGDETDDVASAVVFIAEVRGSFVVELLDGYEFTRSV